MFPSTGHFKSLHCPFYLEDDCGRIYCHFRHVKNMAEKSGENNQLLMLKKRICKDLSIDEGTFQSVMNEPNEQIHEKNLNNLLKKIFPHFSHLIDNFRLPETASKDTFEFLQSNEPSDENVCDLINLTEQDDTPLDEGPLKQFLEENAKSNSNSERKARNTLEKRHIIISCLEKMDKREFNPRRSVQPKKLSTQVKENLVEDAPIDMNEICTQPVMNDDIKIKQEDDGSDSSGSEDNAEVDSILNQMELLNPQLFSSGESVPVKREPTDLDYDKENELKLSLASQETIVASQNPTYSFETDRNSVPASSRSPPFPQPAPSHSNSENRFGRINTKTVQAINSEVKSLISASSKNIKSEVNNDHQERASTNSAILTAATIAEQNRLKNVFKNTIGANIDQFFDLCDACKVYGTEIFNLLEPLFNYLIEKLNPEFNFEKLRQLHSQNISLTCGLPLVGTCDHAKNCIECHNLLRCAMNKCNSKKGEKSTQTISLNPNSTLTDTPLRKIEAGLYDITKEIISLGIPMDNSELPASEQSSTRRPEMKHVQCQTESGSHSRRSSHDHRHSDKKHGNRESSNHKSRDSKSSSESRKRHDDSKRNSSDKNLKHSHSEHRSSRSLSDSHRNKRREKSPSEDDSRDNEREKNAKRRCSSSNRDSELKRRPSDEKSSNFDSKKHKTDNSTSSKSHSEPKKLKPNETISVDSSSEETNESDDSDGLNSIPGLTQLDADSDGEDPSKNNDPTSSEDDEGKHDSDEFSDKYPTTIGKKRFSHVTESSSHLVQRKHVVKKNIPSPVEVLFQRMQQSKKNTETAADTASNQLVANDRIRISHVPNVALLLKAKERLKNNLYQSGKPPVAPMKTVPQTAAKGSSRIAHVPNEPPKPKDIPASAANVRPVINSYKGTNNIPLPTRQNGLDRLYNTFVKKVPPEYASELALKEERSIHEKVTITKIYLNSLAMAVHRISKEDPAKLFQKNTEFPSEINGFATYDLLSKHLLTYEQLEINGFPLGITARPGCCRISTKAIHYKPITSKRSGDRFYCLQCKDLFDVDPETGIPITPSSGCKFHLLRPRKEPGRTRHDIFYPCCNKSISESGCVSSEHHTPDTTDDDCIEGFVETREASPGESSKTFYSLDCEMCYTTIGSELTRVTIIGPDCSTVYDSLVKPRNKILDYCTKFSGITKEKLRHVTKTLEEVRQELFQFIFKDTILIGHSLENDLKALKILHYNIVDTSVMYPHRDAPERKFALKFLSAREVQFLIQESEFGHDSKEDALACMKLVWKKIREDAQSYRPRKIIGSPERNK